MKTKTLRYERLQSLPGMHHVKFGKEIELEDGDDEGEAFRALKADVDDKVGLISDARTLPDEIERLRWERDSLNVEISLRREELKIMRDAVRSAIDFGLACEKAGIEPPKILLDEIPF